MVTNYSCKKFMISQDYNTLILYILENIFNVCFKGEGCPFNHDYQPQRRLELCKYHLQSYCRKEGCLFMHDILFLEKLIYINVLLVQTYYKLLAATSFVESIIYLM